MKAFRERIASYPKGGIIAGEWHAMMRREPWWAEVFAALFTLAWCVWSATVAIEFAHRRMFHAMADMAPDWVWQSSGVAIGLAQLACLTINRRSYRRAACGVAAWWWICILGLVLWADYPAPSIPLYAMPMVINLFSIARLRRDIE